MAENKASADAVTNKEEQNNSGDTEFSLQFSGLSEEITSPTTNTSSLAEAVAKDFNDELEEEHVVAPTSTAQAIKTDHHEHGLSDDDLPKTLTTLETVKKFDNANNDEVEICPVEEEDVEDEEETILLEVDESEEPIESLPPQSVEIKANAPENSQSKGRLIKSKVPNQRANNTTVKKDKPPKSKSILKSDILTREEIEKEVMAKLSEPLNTNRSSVKVDDKITSIKPIPEHLAGTIEIPRAEILMSPDSNDSISSPIILNHVKHNAKKIDSNELIAILEGDDAVHLNSTTNENHFEVSVSIVDDKAKQNPSEKASLSKDEERKIAMQQMLALPTKKKGRPRIDPAAKPPKATKTTVKKEKKDPSSSNDLVQSLVSDWSDSELKNDDHDNTDADTEEAETEILIEIQNADTDTPEIKIPAQRKRKVEVEVPQPTFKRQRVIKKKIIWDPDAPETAINYASYAHTSGSSQQKKAVAKKPPPVKKFEANKTATADDIGPSSASKKKKTSEIDKLLGDEGAVNMLNSLNQENNNNEGATPTKMSRNKTVKTETNEPATTTKARGQRKDPKEVQKSQAAANKKNAAAASQTQHKKKNAKTSADSSGWDYVYSARPDDCMIIRRRSNSSYSSTASPNRSSIDLAQAPPINDSVFETNEKELENSFTSTSEPNKNKRSKGSKIFEFAMPVAKKVKVEASEESLSLVSNIRGNMNKVMGGDAIKKIVSNENNSFSKNQKEKNHNQIALIELTEYNSVYPAYDEITVKRYTNFAQIVLKPLAAGNGGKYKNLLTIKVMQEVESALNTLQNDKQCKLVVISSANSSFCSGIDFTTLIQSTVDKRKAAANDLSKKICHFIQMLASFHKPLIADVQGRVVGVGVTILPLFDIVFAQKDATFETPYVSIGQVPEGCSVFATTNKLNQNVKNELLYLNEKINSADAQRFGLITRVLNSSIVSDEEALTECAKLATYSAQAMQSIKATLQQDFVERLKYALKNEQKYLTQHWISTECQEKFKQYLVDDKW